MFVEIAGIYENDNDFPKTVETCDKIDTFRQDLVSEKRLKKMYKKACKKSGIQGKYL